MRSALCSTFMFSARNYLWLAGMQPVQSVIYSTWPGHCLNVLPKKSEIACHTPTVRTLILFLRTEALSLPVFEIQLAIPRLRQDYFVDRIHTKALDQRWENLLVSQGPFLFFLHSLDIAYLNEGLVSTHNCDSLLLSKRSEIPISELKNELAIR